MGWIRQSTFAVASLIAAMLMTNGLAVAATELRITHTFSSGMSKDAMDAIVAAFEAANPDIKIKQVVFDDDQYQETGLITQLKSSDVPDIYFQWAGFATKRDSEAGYALDLNEALAAGNWKASFSPSAFGENAGTGKDGHVFMIPVSFDITNVIWFNETTFEKHKLSPPKTWTDFVGVVKTLAGAGETPLVIGNKEFWPFGNWAAHIASRVVPPAEYAAAFNRKGKFSTPGFEKAFGLLAELHAAGAFNKDMQGLEADPAMATFFQEAAAMHPIGSWLISEAVKQSDKDFRYGQFDTPVIDPAHPQKDSIIGTFTGFMVSKKSKHVPEALKFLKFFTAKENAHKWVEAGNISPVLGASEGAKVDPHFQPIVDLFTKAGATTSPPDTSYPAPVAEAFYQAAAFVAAGEKTPPDALRWLDEQVKSLN